MSYHLSFSGVVRNGFLSSVIVLELFLFSSCNTAIAETAPTVGEGIIEQPASGPDPAYPYDDGDVKGYILVKNWDFGKSGTIQNMDQMNKEFQYHDQFNTIANGTKYGAYIVAPDAENAIPNQLIEGLNTDRPVREILSDSLRTYLVGLDGAEEVNPTDKKAGSGSFQAKWTLPQGGALLGKDLIWETRVRYKTAPYFWFAIWTCGNKWNKGAEMDLIESFGWDNGEDGTNFEGKMWHSSLVSGVDGKSETNYHKDWAAGMANSGFTDYNPEEYHTWTWVYRADNTFTAYLDGQVVQRGETPWTLQAKKGGEPINMSFIFDGSWGHREVASVNHTLPVSAFDDKFYEWDYSRIYLRDAGPLPGFTQALASLDLNNKAFQYGVKPTKGASVHIVDSSADSKAIQIDFPAGDYPGVVVQPPAGFDLSDFSGIEVAVTNSSAFPLSITARVDNEGNWQDQPYSGEAAELAPGETKQLRVQFGQTFGKSGYALNPEAVTRLMIFINNPKQSGTLTVNSIDGII